MYKLQIKNTKKPVTPPRLTENPPDPSGYNCKYIIPYNVIVVDVDVKNGVDPSPLLAIGGPCVRTPSGGYHFYFDNPIPGRRHAFMYEGYEIFSAEVKKEIMSPPSVIDGVSYVWEVPPTASPLPALPFVLKELTVLQDARTVPAGVLIDSLIALSPYAEDFSSHTAWMNLVYAYHSASGGSQAVKAYLQQFCREIPGYETEQSSQEVSKAWDSAVECYQGVTVDTILFWLNKYELSIQADAIGCYLKQDKVEINLQQAPTKERIVSIPLPPGKLGEMCRDVGRCCVYAYDVVNVVTGLGLLAGIAGRRYNISGTGMNLYSTLLMDTGMGKDQVAGYIDSVLLGHEEEAIFQANIFKGQKRYTGPKALLTDLARRRSMICVFTEAGFLLKSTSGDAPGMTRAVLDAYTKSGQNSWITGEGYSDETNDIPTISSPSLSIINESTPDILIQELSKRDAEKTGELARQVILRYHGDKPPPNFNANKPDFELYRDVILQSIPSTLEEVHEPMNIPIPQELMEFVINCRDDENRLRNSNETLAYSLATRRGVKAMKLASLAAIADNPEHPIIHADHTKWAIEFTEYEMDSIQAAFKGAHQGDDYAIAVKDVVGPVIYKILGNHYKAAYKQMNRYHVNKGIISFSVLSQCLVNNAFLAKLSDDMKGRGAPRSGLKKVLTTMVEDGLLVVTQDRGPTNVSSTMFRITEEFKAFMEVSEY